MGFDPVSWAVTAVVNLAVTATLNAVFNALTPATRVEGPRLSDLRMQTSAYGTAIPLIKGTQPVAGSVIWLQNGQLEEVKTTKKIGGKGGGPKVKQTTYSYFGTFAIMVGVGPLASVTRIWMDNKLVYDITGTSLDKQKNGISFRFYPGDETQLPDSLMEADLGEGNVSAHRGTAYIVFDRLPLGDFGNRLPNVLVEVSSSDDNSALFVEGDPITTGEGGLFSNLDSDSLCVDYNRRRVYTCDSTAGLRVFEMSNMVETRQSQDFYGTFPLESVDDVSNMNLLGVVSSGHVIANYTGASNSVAICSIDPDTLEIVDVFGSSGSSFEHDSDMVAYPRPAACCAVNVASRIPLPGFFFVAAPTTNIQFFIAGGYLSEKLSVLVISGAGRINYVGRIDFGENLLSVTSPSEPGLQAQDYWILTGSSYISPSSADVTLWRDTLHANEGLSYPSDPTTAQSTRTPEQIGTYSPGDLVPGATQLYAAGPIIHDPADGNILVQATENSGPGDTAYLTKINSLTGEIIWQTQIPHTRGANLSAHGGEQSRIHNSRLAVLQGSDVWLVDTAAGEVVLSDTGYTQSVGAQVWDGWSGNILGFKTLTAVPSRWPILSSAGGVESLADVVTDLCERVDLPTSDIDVTDLSGTTVHGYVIGRQMSARAALEQLQRVFRFDGVDSDHLLKFTLRDGKSSVATIEEEELGLVDRERHEYFVSTDNQEVELPLRYNIVYPSIDRDYETGTQPAQRLLNPTPSVRSRGEFTDTVSIAMTDTEARRVAESTLFSIWSESVVKSMVLPWRYLLLDAADVVTVNLSSLGESYRLRIGQADTGADLTRDIKAVVENIYQFTSTVDGDAGSGFVGGSFLSVPFTRLFLPQLPLLADQHDVGRVASIGYFAMAGYGQDGWRSGYLLKSSDAVDFEAEATASTEVEWGYVRTPLPADYNPFDADETNELVVSMVVGDLESVTEAQWLASGNAAAIIRQADPTSPEIIAYRDAAQNADGSWTLTGILRGLRGTSSNAAAQEAGDLFVPLTADTINEYILSLAEVGETRYYKAVASGGFSEDAPIVASVVEGNDLKPYPPVSLELTSGTPGSDMTLEWKRQTRVGGEGIKDGFDTVPLSEDSEVYTLQIIGGERGTVPLRTVTGLTSPTYDYSAANQSSDFGAGYVDVTDVVVLNPSFEDGTDSWTRSTPEIKTKTSEGDIAAADDGDRFLTFAECTASASVSQVVSLADVRDAVWSGLAAVRASIYFSQDSEDTDTGRLDLVWLDGDGNVLSTTSGSEVDPTSGAWTQTTTEETSVPIDAVSLRLEIHGTKNAGGNTNLAADGLTLEFDQGGVPLQISFRTAQVSVQVGSGWWSQGKTVG